jgi:hypothetical protein
VQGLVTQPARILPHGTGDAEAACPSRLPTSHCHQWEQYWFAESHPVYATATFTVRTEMLNRFRSMSVDRSVNWTHNFLVIISKPVPSRWGVGRGWVNQGSCPPPPRIFIKRNKKFWEELIACFLFIRHGLQRKNLWGTQKQRAKWSQKPLNKNYLRFSDRRRRIHIQTAR